MPLRPFSILLPFVTCTNVQLQPPFSSPITFFSQEKHFCSVMISWSFWFQLRFRGLSLLSFFSQERDSVLISWFLLVSAQVLRLASLPFLSFLFSLGRQCTVARSENKGHMESKLRKRSACTADGETPSNLVH